MRERTPDWLQPLAGRLAPVLRHPVLYFVCAGLFILAIILGAV